MAFVKGKSGNVRGRPKGIIDKRARLNKALMGEGDALLKVTVDAAKAGDMGAMSLLLPRMMATLKPEGSPIRFTLDSSLSASKQLEQIIQAVANGQLTIDEASNMAQVVHKLADVRSIEGGGDNADRLAALFREGAKALGARDGMPIPEAPDDATND